jgi:mRNA interferase RelE/StbE
VKKIEWSEGARADVRRLDQKTAMRIFESVLRFAETSAGDVKKLKGEEAEYRLRVGDYRVRFTREPSGHAAHPFGSASP